MKKYRSSDIQENLIREQMPHILDILLLDRTTSTPKRPKNIIWANDNYEKYGKAFLKTAQIKPEYITGKYGHIIMPRSLKNKTIQKERTKVKAEVFTPTWVVKKQNSEIDKYYKKDDVETYIKRKWLEITCGEAPYMASRYDMETGKLVPLRSRVGFVDKKLQKINKLIDDKAEWQRLVELAYKASYGFEWNGDSLLLARENLLYTYRDYYFAKWKEEPIIGLFEKIAYIISYNIFQMDGLKYIIPFSEKTESKTQAQLSLFDFKEIEFTPKKKIGKKVKIMNWDTNKMEYFNKGIENE